MKNIILVSIYILFIPIIVKSQLTGGGSAVTNEGQKKVKNESDLSSRFDFEIGSNSNKVFSDTHFYGYENDFYNLGFRYLYMINDNYQLPIKNIKYGIDYLWNIGVNPTSYANIGIGIAPTVAYNPIPGLVISLRYNIIYEINGFFEGSLDEIVVINDGSDYYGDNEVSALGRMSGLGISVRFKNIFISYDSISGEDFISDGTSSILNIDRSVFRFGISRSF